MAFAQIGQTEIALGSGSGNSPIVSTVGVDFITIEVSGATTNTPSVSDNQGNTYTGLTSRSGGANSRAQIFYCLNPTVNASHQWTLTGGSIYSYAVIRYWSGAHASSVFDVEAGAGNSGSTTLAPGSVTPSVNGGLVLTVLSPGGGGSPRTLTGGFSTPVNGDYAGVGAGASAYLIQTTAAAANPTWTVSSTPSDMASAIAVFKPAAGAAPVITGPTATGGTLTGSGTVSTDTGSGTLWWKVDGTATASDPGSGSETGAGWTSQSVSATGTQTVSSFSTLTSGTKYAHYLHVASGGRSGVVNSAAFTVGTGVTFSGPVANQSGVTGASFSLALATYFSGNMTRTYAVQSGSLSGSGLSLNTSTGVISGTLATVAVYTVTIRATDSYSDTDDTNSFTITVSATGTAPTVSSHPSDTTVTAGATASFTAAASGSPTPTVQWQENTGSWTNISGQTSTTLSLGVVGTIDNGRVFRAVFTNSSGSATTNSATLTVNAASGDGTITSEPLGPNFNGLNGTGTLAWLGFRNATTGAHVLLLTSVAINSSSIFTVTNAALAPGQLYAMNWKTTDGKYGFAWANAV